MPYLQIAAGFLLLFFGGECLVRGAVALARHMGVSTMLVGATVVAFGTSAPELAVAVESQLTGHGDIAIGSVVGSNLANVLLILGATALVRPVAWNPKTVRYDACGLVLASVIFCAAAFAARDLGRIEGVLLVAMLGTLTWVNYWRERRKRPLTVSLLEEEAQQFINELALTPALLYAILGTIGIVAGAHQLVLGAVSVAKAFGVSETVIALTVVAVGTSLPELAACAVAAYRRHSDMALGNVVGSNVFNMLGIGGTAAAIAPLDVPPRIIQIDIWIMLAAMVVAAGWLLFRNHLGRIAGLVLLSTYVVWLASQAAFSP